MSDKQSKQSDQLDNWMALLTDDKERAGVIRAQIEANAQTERVRVEQVEQSRRADIATDGFQGFRIVAVFAIIAAIAGSTCVGYHAIELRAGAGQK